MANNINFNKLVELAMEEKDFSHMRPVIEKELLHYDILFALSQAGILNELVFQGGTSLRLCHGSSRFSEDLDFAGGKEFTSINLINMKNCLESYIGKRYGLEIVIKEPKELKTDPVYAEVHVDKWQLSITTAPGQKSMPKQRIKIEVANVEAYTSEIMALQANYEFLPDGYSDTLLKVESLTEIMADKLIALANTSKYVRYRDIWDLRWLKQKGASVDSNLIKRKIEDYKIENYIKKVKDIKTRLPEIINGDKFKSEMKRFIPINIQNNTLNKEQFYPYLLTEIVKLYDQLELELELNGDNDELEFPMA
jgi:predicted nucleotidyltransferase component of viral defense system